MSQTTQLAIDGEVGKPQTLSHEQLRAIDEQHQIADVSQMAPGKSGRAVTLAGLLSVAAANSAAEWLGLHSSHDNFHASIPLGPVRDQAFLIYEVDGAPLPRSAGGPFRFYVPDHAACKTAEIDECANVKFVDRLELTNEKGFDNRPEDEDEHAELHRKESE